MKKSWFIAAELDVSKALAIEQERLLKKCTTIRRVGALVAAKEAAMRKVKETLSKR
jgi:chemotaxis protein MotB